MRVYLEPAAKELVEHLVKHEGTPEFAKEAERAITQSLYWAYNYGEKNGRFLKAVDNGQATRQP